MTFSATNLGEGVVIPDLIEPIQAYRLWIRLDNLFCGLWAPERITVWGRNLQAGDEVKAECYRLAEKGFYSPTFEHDAPDENCRCGFYCLKTLNETLNHVWSDVFYVGKVAIEGKVIEHDHGYRAQIVRLLHDPISLGEIWTSESQLRQSLSSVHRRWSLLDQLESLIEKKSQ